MNPIENPEVLESRVRALCRAWDVGGTKGNDQEVAFSKNPAKH